jgi:large subunit ribosomal protein L5
MSLLRPCRCLQSTPKVRIRTIYSVSKLSPIQPPPPTSPASPQFVPQKLSRVTRLASYYDEFLAPNYLLMSLDPTAPSVRQPLPLRWDGTSPYHKNRPQPREQPRPRLRHPITAANLPTVTKITVHTFVRTAIQKRAELLSSALAVQQITGLRPEMVRSRRGVAIFKLRRGRVPCKAGRLM